MNWAGQGEKGEGMGQGPGCAVSELFFLLPVAGQPGINLTLSVAASHSWPIISYLPWCRGKPSAAAKPPAAGPSRVVPLGIPARPCPCSHSMGPLVAVELGGRG